MGFDKTFNFMMYGSVIFFAVIFVVVFIVIIVSTISGAKRRKDIISNSKDFMSSSISGLNGNPSANAVCKCPYCGEVSNSDVKKCPSCGAKMK